MIRKFIYSSLIMTIILVSCGGDKYEFWDISKFNIQPSALPDSQEIKLFYCSRGPYSHEDFDNGTNVITPRNGTSFKVTDYYVHYIAIDLESRDTFNILTPEAIKITKDDNNQTFIYTKNITSLKALMFNKEKYKELEAGENISSDHFEIPKHDRVVRDPKYDHVADNNFKTVIGFVNRKKK